MTFQQLRIKQHFYYCLLIALKLARQERQLFSVQNKNVFILKWLNDARKNKLFPKDADAEITWLTYKINTAGDNLDPENMLEEIYKKAYTGLIFYCLKQHHSVSVMNPH